MVFRKWQFWAIVGFFFFDLLTFAFPFAALLLLITALARPVRLFLIDFLLDLEDDKFATLNSQYGSKDEQKGR